MSDTAMFESPVELPDDAPGDDRVDRALAERTARVEREQALMWLMEQAGDDPASIGAALGASISQDPDQIRAAGERIGFTRHIREGVNQARQDVGAVARDLAIGGTETPTQIVGGARDAAQAALNGIDAAGDAIAAAVGDTSVDPDKTGFELPSIREPKSTTGSIIRGVAQFLTGFAAGGTVIKGGGMAAAAAKGAISDFAFFDGQDANLSNLIQSNPDLANPVNEYLASDPEDSEAENRFKRAIEGLGLGAMVDAFTPAVRSIRASRRSAGASARQRAAESRALDPDVVPARPLDMLGPEDGPLVEKMAKASKETATDVPDDVAAKSLTKGLTPLGDGDVFVNFAKIESPDDIKRVIQDVSTALKPSVDDARRGVRTHKETLASAEDIDAFDAIMRRRHGQPLNAEESVAARTVWVAAADKLQAVAKDAASNASPESLFQFRKMLATFHAIQKEVLGARAETARALNSWKIPVGGGRQKMASIEAAMNNFGGVEVNFDLARKVAAIGGDKAHLGEFVEKSVYAKTRDSVQEYWINSILSGPQTHLVNMLSNTYVAGLNMAETAVAARLGRIIGGENVVEVGEALAQGYGAISGFRDALRNAAKSFKTGQTGFGINKIEGARHKAISSTNWGLRSDSYTGRAVDGLGAVVNMPGRALGAEDEFFKTIGYRMSLHSQAYRQVQKEIGEGSLEKSAAKSRLAELIANPDESMSLEAANHAAYQTFTNEPGPMVRWLMQGRAKIPMLKFVIPFLNTPANIFKYTLERTPLAPVSAKFRAAVAKGGAGADIALTKMAMGTMTMMAGLDMAINGQITGSGPSKFSERDNLRRQGWQPNSVRIGDKFFAYNRLDPLGAQLGLAAEMGEYLVNSGELDDDEMENFTRTFAAAVFSVAETATSKTYLTGLSDLVEAVNDPDRFATSYIKRFAGGFIPNIARTVTRANDTVPRYTVGVIDEMKSRLPGFSDDLPPRRDLWGREIKWESGLGQVYDMVSPIYGSTYKPEAIDLEMQKDGWFLGAPGKAFKFEGEEIRLRDRPEVYSKLLEVGGSFKPSQMGDAGSGLIEKFGDISQLNALNAIVDGKHTMSEEYSALTDPEDRERFIRYKVVAPYRRAAKVFVISEFPDLIK